MANTPQAPAIFIKVEGGIRPALGMEDRLPSGKGREFAEHGRIAIQSSN